VTRHDGQRVAFAVAVAAAGHFLFFVGYLLDWVDSMMVLATNANEEATQRATRNETINPTKILQGFFFLGY
jgi:hypothetical protein